MSFSAKIKRELCRSPMKSRACLQAEACGILLFCSCFRREEIRVVTESDDLARRLPALFRRAFQTEFDLLPQECAGKRSFAVTDAGKIQTIGDALGYGPGDGVALHINFGILEEEDCRAAFFRGAFLAGGSVTAPEKGYHLELVTGHYSVAKELSALLREFGFEGRMVDRKSNYVTYFKNSEAIEDFLTAIGAPLAAMEIMNAKAEKNLRGSVNRRVNCDAANLDKAVDAAQGQLETIRRLEKRGELERLPDKLREAALLRRANPEMTLSELARLCDPPVSKSALSHRLRRVGELANGEENTGE
ncbi:MAG: DNA-binding protein WhiA [Oscillospiraceae bacterium]|nr:DNA-binding protein WhiA [Oscillospiraceae bacterium]